VKILAISEPAPDVTPGGFDGYMDAEVAKGKQFYLDGLIEQAYMDPTYTRTFMIVEAPSIDDARARFDTYPRVAAGLISFTFIPLVGMPAVANAEHERGTPLPAWWPGAVRTANE